jgi:phosphoribosylpyrophosphate synthetase
MINAIYDVPFIYIRKSGEQSHDEKIFSLPADYVCNPSVINKSYNLIFIDDFVCSGDTLCHAIKHLYDKKLKLYATAFYNSCVSDKDIISAFKREKIKLPEHFLVINA